MVGSWVREPCVWLTLRALVSLGGACATINISGKPHGHGSYIRTLVGVLVASRFEILCPPFIRVEFFLAPFFFFFGARFFFVGGWCRLELCHFCKLWQEKAGISAEFRVLQPNTPFGA